MFGAEVTVRPTHWHVQFCSFPVGLVIFMPVTFDVWLKFVWSNRTQLLLTFKLFSVFFGKCWCFSSDG